MPALARVSDRLKTFCNRASCDRSRFDYAKKWRKLEVLMEPLSFNEQLGLMLLDKAAIGLIGLGLFFLVQRKLEAYKSQQSFQVEIAKERVKHIADEWNAMNEWDSAVGRLLAKFTELIDEPDVWSGVPRLRMQPDLKTTAELLALIHKNPVAVTAIRDRCKAVLGPYMEDSRKKAEIVNSQIQKNRFWLGKSLYEHCRQFQRRLANVCRAIDSGNYENLPNDILELEKGRDDVLLVLKKIKDWEN